MAWRFKGRASVDPSAPSAFAVCDRCGLWYNHKDLVWQYDWRGPTLQNLRVLVCTQTCLDKPFEHYRPIVVPPDPVPIFNARPEYFAIDEPNFLVTERDAFPLITQDGNRLVTEGGGN